MPTRGTLRTATADMRVCEAKMNTIDRDYRLDDLIEIIRTKKHTTTCELAEITGKTERTIRSDLKLLKTRYYQIVIKCGRYHSGVFWEE